MNEKLRKVLDKCFEDICYAFQCDDYEKAKIQAYSDIKAVFRECVPSKREIGEMRYGGCSPDEDRGFNACRSEILAKLEQ